MSSSFWFSTHKPSFAEKMWFVGRATYVANTIKAVCAGSCCQFNIDESLGKKLLSFQTYHKGFDVSRSMLAIIVFITRRQDYAASGSA